MDDRQIMEKLYTTEHFHSYVLTKLAGIERNKDLRKILLMLAEKERKHAFDWMKILGKNAKEPESKSRFGARFLMLVRSVFGLELAIKIMEYKETQLKGELSKRKNQSSAVKHILLDETKTEMELESKILEHSPVLSNIRDVVFGMNDGLVEIVAAVSGIGAAIQQPNLVIAAGLIVAISGTLSMAGGAYLSTDYGNSINLKKEESYKNTSPKISAFYVGVSYIIGAMFPLLPFILGMSGYIAIAFSILITAIVLVIASVMISVVSDTRVFDRITKTLLITLGISTITILLGIYARAYLHLMI